MNKHPNKIKPGYYKDNEENINKIMGVTDKIVYYKQWGKTSPVTKNKVDDIENFIKNNKYLGEVI